MKIKVLAGSAMAVGLLGLGVLAGSVVGSGGAFAQTSSGSATSVAQVVTTAQAATTPTPGSTQTTPAAPEKGTSGSSSITAKLTQQQAEQAALVASPGSTVDHTVLQNQNGTPVYDVDFTNGGGVQVNGNTGAVITAEAAGQDQGGHGGRGGPRGGADQAALAAQAKVTQQQAEQAALTASPGSAVDHSILQDQNGTIVWDVDFTNGGGVQVNALTGATIKVEAAGEDVGGHGGRPQGSSSPSSTPATQP